MKNLPFGPVSYSVNAFNYKFTCYLVKLLKAKSRNCRSVKKVTLDVNILNVLTTTFIIWLLRPSVKELMIYTLKDLCSLSLSKTVKFNSSQF